MPPAAAEAADEGPEVPKAVTKKRSRPSAAARTPKEKEGTPKEGTPKAGHLIIYPYLLSSLIFDSGQK